MKNKRPRIIREKKVNVVNPSPKICFESELEEWIHEYMEKGWKLIDKDEYTAKLIQDGVIMNMFSDGIFEFEFEESDEDPERGIMASFRNGTQDNFGY